LQGTIAPVTSAIVDYIQVGLGYKIDQPYHLLSYECERQVGLEPSPANRKCPARSTI